MAVKRTLKKRVEATEDITIVEAFDEFYNEKAAANLAVYTLNNYRKTFKQYMEFCEFDEETLLSEVTASTLYEWMGTMKLEGTKVTTVNAYLRNIKVFFKWCMDEDRDYMKPFKFPVMRGQEEPLKLFDDEALEILLEKPANPNDYVETRTWMIVNWILATGNRGATVCEVRVGDVNFKSKEIILRHTKNKKSQTLPLSPTLEKLLKKWIKEWRSPNPEAYMFPNIGDEKLSTASMRAAFIRYCKERGVPQTNIHGLRHNFAKQWVLNGGNVFALQKVLGHSTLEMTKRYVKLFGEDIKTDYEKFSALDTIKKNSRRTQVVTRGR